MPSELAQRIRNARTTRGITLDEAERATKIRRKYLEAIEAGDFAQLPDGPPARGFVKNYARFLGLDPELALGEFETEVGIPILMLQDPPPPPPVRHKPTSRLTQVALPDPQWKEQLHAARSNASAKGSDAGAAHVANAQSLVARRDSTTSRAVASNGRSGLRASGSSFRLKNISGPFREYDPNMMTARGPKPVFSALPRASWFERYAPYALGGAALAAALAFLLLVVLPEANEWIESVLPPPQQVSSNETPFVPEVTIFAPQPTRQPVAAAGEVAPTIVGTPEPVPAVQPVTEGLQLALDARERAWVRVRVDGNVVFEGIPPIGPSIPFSAKQNIQVETGNAGAFDIILNNVRLGSLGARNETVAKTWSAGGQ